MNGFKFVRNNLQIQVFRALFCLIIVFYHYTSRYSEIFGIESVFSSTVFSYLAPMGVIPFLILSGFYLVGRKPLVAFKDKVIYWLKRLLSIYCVYLIAVTIIYLLSFTGLFGAERTVSFVGYLQNLIFINVATGIGYVDGAHWYVVALLCLYLLAFICDLLPKKENDLSVIFWSAFLIISIACLFGQKYLDSDSLICKATKLITLFLCQGWFPYAFIGISIFLFDFEKINNWKNILLIVMVALALAYIGINNWIYLLITFIVSTLIILALFQKMIFLEKAKPLIFIGNASYSIYLLHQNIGYMFLNLFTKAINYYICLIITILVVLTICVAFSYFVEKNIKKIISNIGNHQTQISNESTTN